MRKTVALSVLMMVLSGGLVRADDAAPAAAKAATAPEIHPGGA